MQGYKNPTPKLPMDRHSRNKASVVKRQDDYSNNGDTYFAFIDVLGFKKTFIDNKDRGIVPSEFAKKYKVVFNYYFNLMEATSFMKSPECYAGQTSDSLYFYTTRIDILIEFIQVFSHFNYYSMSQDVFFRGGITKGCLFKKEKYQFYGDSVMNAYLMESVIATEPVVYIDRQTYEDLSKNMENISINKIISANNDRYYIKPFAQEVEIKSLLNKDTVFCPEEIDIKKIKKNLEDNKKLFEYEPKNYNKYIFLIGEFKKYFK